jgi:hypothetical protein
MLKEDSTRIEVIANRCLERTMVIHSPEKRDEKELKKSLTREYFSLRYYTNIF